MFAGTALVLMLFGKDENQRRRLLSRMGTGSKVGLWFPRGRIWVAVPKWAYRVEDGSFPWLRSIERNSREPVASCQSLRAARWECACWGRELDSPRFTR